MLKNVLLLIGAVLVQNMLFAQQYNTSTFSLQLNDKGSVASIRNNQSTEYSVASDPGLLLQLVKNGGTIAPTKAEYKKGIIALLYPGGYKAAVKVSVNKDYVRFELTDISDNIDAVIWGPLNNSIKDTIGNTVGVVRNKEFAFGIQCLNEKTTGGKMVNDEGAVYERGTTATAAAFGSSLQAFTINRSHDRVITVWEKWQGATVKGSPEGGLKGSAVAIFGCSPSQVLNTIKTITKQENLPFATWNGEWIKASAASGAPYMITSFSENNIDSFLTVAKQMGMAGVYHEGPFETWGHFVLDKKSFPNGREGFKKCVDKAHSMGLRVGFHTLTTFMTTNDAYVSPKPSQHLALAGTDTLAGDVTADATEITVNSPLHFTMRSDLNSVIIGDEIVRYMSVSTDAPYKLSGCTRGAFGTTKSAHKAKDRVSRLVDYPYHVFFPDFQLQKEVAKNIADFINETGADQMDFDGHEGTYSCGMGDLGMCSFADDVFRQVKHPVVFGSSRANHYFWHINNYLNWGEPWYGSMRESQTDYRIDNQKYLQDNYMPNMLGWFLITANSTPDDIDWMLARAAGFNAGYALVVRQDALANKNMPRIIEQINLWTEAQKKKMFNQSQIEWLKNPANEVRLSKKENSYYLESFHKFSFEHKAKVLQPGEPATSNFTFINNKEKQRPQITITAHGDDGSIINPVIEIDNAFRLEIPVTLAAGQSLAMSEGNVASIYNSKGKFIKKIELTNQLPVLEKGTHSLSFEAGMDANGSVKAVITVRLSEKTEQL
ncbi:hypothetical protein [Pinibacter soli]|uniref:Uncharacterized protein n=1 Tax=Pinibacter soli TaxID=3044211 RepID=A0ABT6RA95_9BACT|nr:hypothetical protein [Pinibacter soli]MDI3319488.1 hypothetical protein [Pinibacter soli]